MITPDYLEQVMSQAQNTLNGASERIIQTLARRLEATITRYGKNDLIPTSLNEILNLEEVGMTYAEVQKEVEEALPQIRDQVREAFIKGAEKMNEYYGGGVRDTYKEGKEQPKTEPKEEPKNPVKPPLPEKDYDFPDFVATTGYGNMLGLCGINCRHTFSMFFPNLQDSTPDVIDEKANRKKYQAEQQARAMERQIRAKKQALSAYQAVSDEIGKAKKQALVNEINSLIKQYQNFCRTNSVSMTEWRLATYDSHASFTKPRNNAKATPNASNMSGAMKKKLEEVYRRTNGDIYNICQTTAPSTQDTFINACDDAFMNIQMGMPLNEAISRAIDQVAEKGVSCVYYDSGRVDKMEVALARAIRTGINQANAQLVLMKCAELGIDYVKVSAHYGARVTKQNDYTNHSWWQGKVYKLNWSNKALNGFKNTNNPPDTEKATEQPETAPIYANNTIDYNINQNAIKEYAKQKEKELDELKKQNKKAVINIPNNYINADNKEGYVNLGDISHIDILEETFGQLITSNLILTADRETHIRAGDHPNDYIFFLKYIKELIKDPDMIFKSSQDYKTAIYVKLSEDKNVAMVVSLALEAEKEVTKHKDNSIITSFKVQERQLKQVSRKNTLLYKKEGI